MFFEPGTEIFQNVRSEAVCGVDKVAGDDEFDGFVKTDEGIESREVIGGIALWDGDAAGAEGGGFSEVDIGDDETAGIGEKNATLREKLEGGLSKRDLHGSGNFILEMDEHFFETGGGISSGEKSGKTVGP